MIQTQQNTLFGTVLETIWAIGASHLAARLPA